MGHYHSRENRVTITAGERGHYHSRKKGPLSHQGILETVTYVGIPVLRMAEMMMVDIMRKY